jgi:hypothetical protein
VAGVAAGEDVRDGGVADVGEVAGLFGDDDFLIGVLDCLVEAAFVEGDVAEGSELAVKPWCPSE